LILALYTNVATGRVEIDMCMTRWRDFYHRTVWTGLAVDPRTAPTDGVTTVGAPIMHAWFASDSVPTDGSHWKPAPCITAPNTPYPHLINLIKLRTSNHKLAIQQLRQVYPIIPRASRRHALFADSVVMYRMSAT
jgi:hypothetical protein